MIIKSNKQTFLLLSSKTHVFCQHPQDYARLTSQPASRVKSQTLFFLTFINWKSSRRKNFITIFHLCGYSERESIEKGGSMFFFSISVLAVRMSYGVTTQNYRFFYILILIFEYHYELTNFYKSSCNH